ncbi:MAG: hypothetical protein H6813_03970 [Phycisphaeraceae bacterium]|nr:hypothetical protein [Phycisphaeraceae bacterium]MCB9847103.1 hypothetical protein [Phycisphaeraceae bacterium]
MPEGSVESAPELDLDEQVQQLVESIETTTRGIEARTAADFGEDPLFASPMLAQDGTKLESTEAAAPPPTAVAEDEPGMPDAIESAEEALSEIDEAVNQLVDHAVDSVDLTDEEIRAAATATEDVEAIVTETETDAAETADAAETIEPVESTVAPDEVEPQSEAATVPPIEEPFDQADAIDAVEDVETTAGAEEAVGSAAESPAEIPTVDETAEPADEDAIEGDFDTVEDTPTATEPEPADTVSEPETATDPESSTDDEIDDFGTIEDAAPAEPTPAPADPPARTAGAEPDPPPAEPEASPKPEPATASRGRGRLAFASMMVGKLTPALERVIIHIDAPTRRLSPRGRQIVGLVAINTAFLALCALIVVLLRVM